MSQTHLERQQWSACHRKRLKSVVSLLNAAHPTLTLLPLMFSRTTSISLDPRCTILRNKTSQFRLPEGQLEPRLHQEIHGQIPASSPYEPGLIWQRFLKAWHMCTSSVEKKFFVQSLLPLLSLFNYLHTALTYSACALCAFLLLKKKKPTKTTPPTKPPLLRP